MDVHRIAVLSVVLLAIGLLHTGCGGDSSPSAPANPSCQVSPTSLAFGSVVVGGSADLTFTIQNTGGGTLSGTISETCDEFSIVGGASYSLTAGQSATFTVRFAPTSAGSKSCTIETGSTICSDVGCTATATLGPVCQVIPTTLPFGNVEVGSSTDLTFTIENTGGGTLSGTVTESCDDFSIISTPSYSLSGGQSATFTIRFAPTSTGSKSCTLDTGNSSCADVACTGNGTLPPACQVSPSSLSFGSVTVGTTSDLTFTIQNTGGGILSGTVSEACDQFSIVGTTLYSLGAGESATFTVRFAPTSEAIVVCNIDTASPSCPDLNCDGTGVIPPVCQVDPTVLDFGDVIVGVALDLTFTIQNAGGGTLAGTVTETSDDFSIISTPTYSLGSGQAAVFTVRFAPTSGGPKTCTIDTGASGCPDVACTGNGNLSPSCQVSPTSLAFGSVVVGGSADLTFTIQNTGGGTLSGTISETCDEFSIVGGASYSLTAGQSATFTVRFAPTSAGSKSCTIETGSTICSDVGCTATATLGPVCQVIPTTLPFGNVEVGSSTDLTFTIENTGGGTLSGTVTESCDDFSIISTPSYSLSGGQSATFTIRFAPTSTGFKSCVIETSAECPSDVSCYGIGYVGTPWYCVDFDGINDYAFVSAPSFVNSLSSVTVEAWIKRAKSGTQLILDKRSTSGNGYALGINSLGYLYFTFSGYTVTSAVWLPFDQWVFVTGQYDSSVDLLQVYTNGILTGSLYLDILAFYSYGSIYIGRDYLGLYFFGGRIDELAIYNTATRSGSFVPPAHLSSVFARALWPLDEGAGSSLHDWSAWGNDATLVGGSWVQFIITESCGADSAALRQNVLESD